MYAEKHCKPECSYQSLDDLYTLTPRLYIRPAVIKRSEYNIINFEYIKSMNINIHKTNNTKVSPKYFDLSYDTKVIMLKINNTNQQLYYKFDGLYCPCEPENYANCITNKKQTIECGQIYVPKLFNLLPANK